MTPRVTSRRTRLLALAAAPLLVAGGASVGWAASAGEPPTVVREPLAESKKPRGADGRDLGLSRVTVMPEAELAAHHHPGTQVAFVERGTLTYTVLTGKVRVMTGSSEDPELVRRIEAGETGRIRAGQWIVEQPSTIHRAARPPPGRQPGRGAGGDLHRDAVPEGSAGGDPGLTLARAPCPTTTRGGPGLPTRPTVVPKSDACSPPTRRRR